MLISSRFFVGYLLLTIVIGSVMGCGSIGVGNINRELSGILPPEAALKIVNERVNLGSDLMITVLGGIAGDCKSKLRRASIRDITSAHYFSYADGRSSLLIQFDHPENTFTCRANINLGGITEGEASEFLTALKSLGANRLINFPINRFR